MFSYGKLWLAATVLVALLTCVSCGGTDYSDDPALFTAASIGDNREVERLIDGGVDVDERDESEQTPLMAASGIHLNTMELLIASGADVNARSNVGWSPIMLAYHRESPAAVALLVESEADLSITDDVGEFTEDDLCSQAQVDANGEMVEVLC